MPAERKLIRRPASAPPVGYGKLLTDIKTRIRAAQVKAVLAVNRELILLYWEIGHGILVRQQEEGWGAKVVDRLARDLHAAFPGMHGFSSRNLKYMRAFAEAYPQRPFVQQVAAQIPWFHNCLLLDRLRQPDLRHWYIHQTISNGWSRNMLAFQIASGLHQRQGRAITNFRRTLPPPQSDLAQQTLKDPYNFDFLTLAADAHERDLEQGLLDHIQRFLVELGVGFAFVGRQYLIEVDEQDYFLDLLFYHLRLRCFVVLDLKMKPFQPEFAGKMNFYLSAVDDQLRHPDDKSSIGLLLCQSKQSLTVEYALRDLTKPIGVAEWQTKLVESLPKELKGKLPAVAEIEAELRKTSARKRSR